MSTGFAETREGTQLKNVRGTFATAFFESHGTEQTGVFKGVRRYTAECY